MADSIGEGTSVQPAVTGLDGAPSSYQLTLAGLQFPIAGHVAFNALAAAGMWLIGHPAYATALLAGATGIDLVQRAFLRRWIAESASTDPTAGLRRLAWLCALRVAIYIAPVTVATVVHRGMAELTFLGIQYASLLTVAMGAGSLSRVVFWGFCGPLMAALAVVSAILFPPITAAGIFLVMATLTALLMLISANTTKSITTWHAAFTANVALVSDLEAARDLAVAERKEADEAREAARAANLAKSNFLATMSHEIRTPMNGVLGMAQLLKRDETDPGQIERLEVLIDSGEYLLSILNDILDISKIDAGKLEIVPASEDVRELLGRLVSFWRARADERGVELTLDVAPEVPARLLLDALRLRQVLFNLVGNALKFTKEGRVAVRAEATDRDDGGVVLRLTVSDTGPGIAPAHLQRLFDRFSQADGSEARQFGGTGLGLAIVKQLVELMGGRVWVESELGRGADFHLELPAQVGEAAFDAPAAPVPAADLDEPASLRILIVDDNEVNLLVLEQLLSSLGQDLAKASSGAEALDLLGREAFDLVLTDIHMPGMTGIEMLHALRARHGQNHAVPVVALTADVTSGGRQRYLDLGFADHASKPIQLHELLGAISAALAAPEPESAAASA